MKHTANRRKQKVPPMPPMEVALTAVRGIANETMLPQSPYAVFIAGYGWVIDSICSIGAILPLDAKSYNVSVLPERYFS